MAASYPDSVKAWTNKTDGVDDILAAHINEAYDEIKAIETQLLDADVGLGSKIPQNFSDATDETVLLSTDLIPLNKSDGTYKKISFAVIAAWVLSTFTIALDTVAQNIKDAINELVGAVVSETARNNAWNASQDNIVLGNLSDTIRQSAMISRTGTGVKNGITLVNPISFKDSGARVEMLGVTTDGVNVVNPVVKTVGKNLFDKSTATLGYYIDANGTLQSGATWHVSDFIPVIPGKNYKFYYLTDNTYANVCFYNNQKVINSAYSLRNYDVLINSLIINVPADMYYFRFSFNNDVDINTEQFELGSVVTAHEAFKSNSLALTGTLRSVVDTSILYQDRLYNSNGQWKIDRYVNPANGLKQAMATESATVTGVPYVYHDGTTTIETSVIAPIVDMKIPYADVNNTYTPTLTWTTATPTITTSSFRYAFKAGRCMLKGQCVMSDGKGATNLTITLPAPVRVGSGQSVVCMQLKINTTWSAPIVQIIESTNLITFKSAFDLTNGQAAEFEFYVEYEVA